MKVYQHDLFPVPVRYYEGFLPLDLATNIKNYVLDRKNDAGPHSALTGNAISLHGHSNSFIKECTAEVEGCKQLQDNIMVCAQEYAALTGFSDLVLRNSWFNIQGKGSLLKRHMHVYNTDISLFCSGVLYINVEDTSAQISFENPNPYTYLFTQKTGPRTKYNHTQFSFQPGIGDLILFPSWLIHSNPEPNITENRITISFNISV